MVKKKIVHIIDILEQGGAQKLIFDLMRVLKKDFYFYVLAFEGGVFHKRIEKLGIPVKILGISSYKIGFRNPSHIFKTLNWLKKKLESIQPDIIQTHLLGADIWARLAAPSSSKIIQTVHSAEKFRGKATIKGIKTFFFDRLLFKKTDLIIAVSQAAAQGIIREIINKEKIKIIPVGIDIKDFSPNGFWRRKKRQKLGVKNNEILIGAIGRLDWVKGFDILLKAFSKIKKENNHLKLVIVGGGREKKNLESIIEKENLSKQINLLGERKDIAKLLNAFDIFVLSSRWEGLPLSLIEAAANKKAIIATNVGGVPEFIKNKYNGLLVESENYQDLTQKIDLLLSSRKLRKKIAQNAFASIKDFDIKKIAKEYKKIYLSL